MTKIANDDRLNATHVSLYIALFTYWNHHHFQNPLRVNREDLMKVSKIGSKNTYHKCIKQLSDYGFLRYESSNNPLLGSKVLMIDFSAYEIDQLLEGVVPKVVQVVGSSCPKNGTTPVPKVVQQPYIKQLKHKGNELVQKWYNYTEPL